LKKKGKAEKKFEKKGDKKKQETKSSPDSSPTSSPLLGPIASPFDQKFVTNKSINAVTTSSLDGKANQKGSANTLGDGWTVYKDVRKEKRLARHQKKKELAEQRRQENIARGDIKAAEAEKEFRAAAARADTVDEDEVYAPKKGTRATKKKKKKAIASSQSIVVSSESDLVRLILRLFSNLPNNVNFFTVSNLAQSLQEATGQAWNKKFKKVYGSLPTFLKKHEEFTLTDNNDQVIVRVKSQRTEVRSDQASQQSQAKAVKSTSHSTKKHSVSRVEVSDSESNSCIRILLVIIVIVVVAVITLASIEGGPGGASALFKSLLKKLTK